jgi:hypothetical protein
MRAFLLALAVAAPISAQAQFSVDEDAYELRRELQSQRLDERTDRNQMILNQQEEIDTLKRINRNLARIANELRRDKDERPEDLFEDDYSLLDGDSIFEDEYP